MAFAIYVVVGLALLATAALMNINDTEKMGCIVVPVIIVYGILGGVLFGGQHSSSDDDACPHYAYRSADC